MIIGSATTMGVLDFLLPTPATQQQQLTTLIQKQVTDIMSDSKFGSASAVTQSANVTAVGPGSVNSGIDISQIATINTAAFLNDNTALQLKSDLKEKLTNSIQNQASNMPFGQQQNVNTTIANVVDKSIETKFSRESLMELNNAVNQTASVAAVAGGTNTDIAIAQKADVITKFSSSVGTDIATQLTGNNTTSNTSDTKTTNFLSETIASVGSAISSVIGGLFTGIYAGPVIMFAMFMCVVFAAVYIMKGGSHSALQQAQMGIPVGTPVGIPVGTPYGTPVGIPYGRPAGGTTLADLGIDMSKLTPVGVA